MPNSISTFIRAIKNNNYISWPGLTADLISKHLPKSLATAKGHLNQERQNLQSTQSSIVVIKQEPDIEANDFFHFPNPQIQKLTNVMQF